MTNGGAGYTETCDLYLQMLSEARKMEDRRLARLLIRRILDHQQVRRDRGPGIGNIVSLPGLCGGAAVLPAEPEAPFYAHARFWQELILFLAIASVGMSWLFYFFYLVTQV